MPEAYHARLYPVERTPGGVATGTGNYNAGGVAPHGLTNRWTYTVPTAKAAQLESVLAFVQRDTVAAPVGAAVATITAAGVSVLYAGELNNVVGTVTVQALGHCGFLLAGEQLIGSTLDAGTGGTHDYVVTAHYREFPV